MHPSNLLRGDRRGAAVVEFALVAPVLLAMMGGIVSYGGWFWMAHTLQQAANDGARATLAGLNAGERSAITASAVGDMIRSNGGPLDPAKAAVSVEESGETLTVRIRYDAGRSPLLAMSLVPLPSTTIRRSAVIRLAAP